VPPEVPPAAALRQLAVERRPDLASLDAQIQEERAKLALACQEFYPDVEVFGRYDTFWQEEPLRSQVGMNVNLPIYRDRRWAAVNEEALKLRQRRAELQYQIDVINNEVHAAYERVVESQQIVELYNSKLLPAAQQNVESARAGYVAAKVDFLRLIEAQRQLIELQQQAAEADVDLLRRIAECERAVGGSLQPR
jgi:outer membrane protein TolC